MPFKAYSYDPYAVWSPAVLPRSGLVTRPRAVSDVTEAGVISEPLPTRGRGWEGTGQVRRRWWGGRPGIVLWPLGDIRSF